MHRSAHMDDELGMEGVEPPLDDELGMEGVDPTDDEYGVEGVESENDGMRVEDNNAKEKKWEPEIGMEFQDDEQAYGFYNEYARRIGFSIRKQNLSRNSSGQISFRRFVCYKEGFSRIKPSTKEARYDRVDERTGCKAHIGIKLVKGGRFCVYRFVAQHNHDLATPDEAQRLRSQREANKFEVVVPDTASKKRMKLKPIFDFLPSTVGGRCALPFSHVNFKSCLNKVREHEMKPADVEAVIRHLQKKAIEDRRFYSAIQVDVKDQITNVFWTDARSKVDYAHFSDVVSFDTTYKTNEYGRPFAPFIGVNHHKQIVIFGAALLYDETCETFKWLFGTFKEAMGGKAPQVILTDQDAAIINAIKEVWPDTTHRICVWHMYQSSLKHLKHEFKSTVSFKTDFSKCMFEYEYEDEFLSSWQAMLKKYQLTKSAWLSKLFEDRRKWALVYGREMFSADMKSCQRTERMNVMIKGYLSSDRDLMSFFRLYDRLIEDRRYDESEADFRASQCTPEVPHSRILKQAASIYTPKVYEMFAKEFELYIDSLIQECGAIGTANAYKVTNVENHRTGFVRYDSMNDTLTCNCKKFEFVGIVCWHLLKVLDYKNIKEIPEKYILKRWRKDAKAGIVIDLNDSSTEVDPKAVIANRYNSLGRVYGQIMAKGSESQEAYEIALREAQVVMKKLDQALEKRIHDINPQQHSNDQHECLSINQPHIVQFRDQPQDPVGDVNEQDGNDKDRRIATQRASRFKKNNGGQRQSDDPFLASKQTTHSTSNLHEAPSCNPYHPWPSERPPAHFSVSSSLVESSAESASRIPGVVQAPPFPSVNIEESHGLMESAASRLQKAPFDGNNQSCQ